MTTVEGPMCIPKFRKITVETLVDPPHKRLSLNPSSSLRDRCCRNADLIFGENPIGLGRGSV